jgi:hypothetical protein
MLNEKMTSGEYRLNTERKILSIIKEKLESGEMSPEHAQEVAKCVKTELRPDISFDEIYAGIAKIAEQFPEFSQLEVFSNEDREEHAKRQALPEVHRLIEEGNIEGADEVVKEVLDGNYHQQ